MFLCVQFWEDTTRLIRNDNNLHLNDKPANIKIPLVLIDILYFF